MAEADCSVEHPWLFAGIFAVFGGSNVWILFYWLGGLSAVQSLAEALVFASLWFIGRGAWLWRSSAVRHQDKSG
jgi:hypothetical protein